MIIDYIQFLNDIIFADRGVLFSAVFLNFFGFGQEKNLETLFSRSSFFLFLNYSHVLMVNGTVNNENEMLDLDQKVKKIFFQVTIQILKI